MKNNTSAITPCFVYTLFLKQLNNYYYLSSTAAVD